MTEKKAEYKTEPEQPKTIEHMTTEALKAMVYDILVMIQQGQNNLNLIQAEIAKRAKVPGAQ
jgi:hypothetical protein